MPPERWHQALAESHASALVCFGHSASGTVPARFVRSQVASGNDDVVPVIDEATWRRSRQQMALAHKMRLIEIPGFVQNVGPAALRRGEMCDERDVKADDPGIVLGRKPHLCLETAPELARPETR